MKKRTLSIFIVLCMLLSFLPLNVFADVQLVSENITESSRNITFSAISGKHGFSDEDYTNLLDGKKSENNFSKWCVYIKDGAYVVIKASERVLIDSYTFTTGNDNTQATGRNPKSWTVYGSNDYDESSDTCESWVEIHSVTNDSVMKESNFTDYKYDVDSKIFYKYYKFEFLENHGNDLMQLCEICFDFDICEHNWEKYSTKESTCIEYSTITECCTTCGELKTEKDKAPLGHSLDENYYCSRCGKYGIKEVGDFVVYSLYLTDGLFSYENGTLTVLSEIPITISNKNPENATSNVIVVEKDVAANITLAGVNVNSSKRAFTMMGDTTEDINITLADGTSNTFKSTNPYAAMEKNTSEGKLIIKCEHCDLGNHACDSNCGKLIAIGGDHGAGIGGGWGQDGKNISIKGGNITATGGYYAAGIGGGDGGACSGVVISGGAVTANSGSYACAIGNGINGSSTSDIVISGGSVKVNGAIGATPRNSNNENSGIVKLFKIDNPNNDYVAIDGKLCSVVNHSGVDSADKSLYAYVTEEDHTIQIGTTVYTYTYENNEFKLKETASISDDWEFNIISTDSVNEVKYNRDYKYENGMLTILSSFPMTISNKDSNTATSNVIVIAKDVAADITLAGVNVDSSKRAFTMMTDTAKDVNITLADGTSNTFKSTNPYAAMEKNTSEGKLIIKCEHCESENHICDSVCGKLIAIGGDHGAGIGGGWGQDGKNISINGGNITATGGYGAAGIGGGDGGKCSGVVISGGAVTANGGSYACAIGNGMGGTTTDIIISGGSIKVNGNIGTTPTNADETNPEKVYLLKIDNTEKKKVLIDGKIYSAYNHQGVDNSDSTLYAYVAGKNHILKIGDKFYHCHYKDGSFEMFGFATDYTTCENGHGLKCLSSDCDEIIDISSHTYKNGQCTVCGDYRLYTVKYVTDGGTAISTKTTVKWSDKVLNDIAIPERDGFVFVRWESNGVTVTDDTKYSDLVSNDSILNIEIVAKWICLAKDSNEFANSITDENTVGIKMMSDIKMPSKILMVGEFSLDLNGYVLDSEIKMYNNTLTLTDSRPTANHTDSSLAKGGILKGKIEMTRPENGYPDAIIIGNGGTVTASVSMNSFVAKITSTSDVKTVFTNWVGRYGTIEDGIYKGDIGGTIKGGLFYKETEAKIRGLKVNFESISAFAVTQKGGKILGADTLPKKTGYTCVDKWYKDSAASEKWDFANDTVTANMTLYGKFTPNKYTVRFYTGDENSMYYTQSFTYDEPKNLADMFFNKDGCVFVGWSTTTDGKGTIYGDKEEVSNLTAEPNGTVKLYPIWKPEYTTLSGTVKNYGNENDTVTVKLLKSTDTEVDYVVYETTARGNNATFSIDNILTTDKYIVEISVDSHATVRKSLVINSANPMVDYEINLYGDVNLDGVVDVLDIAETERVINKHSTLNGYSFSTADTNSNGIIDVNDYTYTVNKALES